MIIELTISSGQSVSDSFAAGDQTLTGLLVESAWTAAGVAIQGSLDGTNFYTLKDSDGDILEIASLDVDFIYKVNPVATLEVPYLRLWSQSGGVGVNQGADRNIKIILRDYS